MVKVHIHISPRENPNFSSILSLQDMLDWSRRNGINYSFKPWTDGTIGPEMADIAIESFLSSDCTHIFFAADDLLYPPFTLKKLVEDNVDVVSGVYLKRDEPVLANWVGPRKDPNELLKSGTMDETKNIASHTMTIKRNVIEKMIRDYPELLYKERGKEYFALFLPFILDQHYLRDDWAFSYRARKSGFKLWHDYSVILQHRFGGWRQILPQ